MAAMVALAHYSHLSFLHRLDWHSVAYRLAVLQGDKSADSAAANTQTEQGQSGGGAAAVQHADLMHNPATNPGSKKMMNPMIDDDEDSSEEDAVPSSGEAPAPAPGPEALAPAAMASEAPSSSETNGMAQPGTGLSAVSAGSGSIGAASSVAGSMMSTGTAASDEDLSAGVRPFLYW
eukprot:SAG31_NODE_1300_length_8906_cov_139.354604_4_plen_177_part_00